MSHYVAVLVPRPNGGWRAYLPDVPGCRADSQEVESAIVSAIRLASELIDTLPGGELPQARSLEEIRTDDAWARNCEIDWTKALVSVVPVTLRNSEKFRPSASHDTSVMNQGPVCQSGSSLSQHTANDPRSR